ncbi:MAG: hypothetical protein M1827_000635 [Pycnora praestabilis]|nr:MAG: hypothetical protein M1827_000635 [Pycnora praestabilis]
MAATNTNQPRRKMMTYGKLSHKHLEGVDSRQRLSPFQDSDKIIPSGSSASHLDEREEAVLVIGSYIEKKPLPVAPRERVHQRGSSAGALEVSDKPSRSLGMRDRRGNDNPERGDFSAEILNPQAKGTADSAIFDQSSSDDEVALSRATSNHSFREDNGFLSVDSVISKGEDVTIFDVPAVSDEEIFQAPTSSRLTSRKRRRVAEPFRGDVSVVFDDDTLQRYIAQESTEESATDGTLSGSSTKAALPSPSHEPQAPTSNRRMTDQLSHEKLSVNQLQNGSRSCVPKAARLNALPSKTFKTYGGGTAEPLQSKYRTSHNKVPHTKALCRPAHSHSFAFAPSVAVRAEQRMIPPSTMACKTYRRTPSMTPPAAALSPSELRQGTNNAQHITTPQQARLWDELLITHDSPSHLKLKTLLISDGDRSQGKPYGMREKGIESIRRETGQTPRRRLIDALSKEAMDDDSSESMKPKCDESDAGVTNSRIQSSYAQTNRLPRAASRSDSGVSVVDHPTSTPVSPSHVEPARQRAGPKVTYAHQRSYLTESMSENEALLGIPLASPIGGQVGRTGGAKVQTLGNCGEDTNDSAPVGAIRSIHELRQAGGNKRFLDEIETCFEDIEITHASSLSRKRAGLLELSSKLEEKSFARRFLDHGLDHRLFAQLDREQDIIVEIALVAAMIFLITNGATNHTIMQMRKQGAITVLVRLLDSTEDIRLIAKQKKTNMSKVAQSLISELQDQLQRSSVWATRKPFEVSPRILAMRCIESTIRRTRETDDMGCLVTSEAIDKLVHITRPFSAWTPGMHPSDTEIVELETALSILESYTINAESASNKSFWTGTSIAPLAALLPSIASWPAECLGQIQLLALRLGLNLTNNNSILCALYTTDNLVKTMYRIIKSEFENLSRILLEDERLMSLDLLILALGLLINLAEWNDAARSSALNQHDGQVSLCDGLLRLFLDRLATASEADSMEETHSNVAFGYLSVLLGNLCHNRAINVQIRSKLPGRTLRPLIDAIEEFLLYNRKVDDELSGITDDNDLHGAFTDRLRSVVDRLVQTESAN